VLRHRHGERVATFATATFVANSVAEMYVMQRYLQPDRLERVGLATFDAWAATFGRTVTALELAPDGGSYRFNTRFARFVNVPELLTLFGEIADVHTADQLDLPRPRLVDGRAETVVVGRSDGLAAYVATLVERAEQVRSRMVRPDEDNMLKISGDGRKAALDVRLVGQPTEPGAGKIAAAAERIAAIWADSRDHAYLDPDGRPARRRGALQLVFCDLGTPGDGWNVYDELRAQLAALGLPAEAVRFVHEAGNDKAKAELFAACRDGRVAVLVGSTEKMGVGTNVQRRAIALHHLDAPWRPADIEQRQGRIERQGNQNTQVRVIRYVTEGSFDIFMWQTLERKAAFIHQVTRGEPAAREIDDVGDHALSYSQVKALATGNPLIMEKAGVENEIAKLGRLARAHQREQHSLAQRRAAEVDHAERLDQRARQCAAALQRRVDTRGEQFAMTVDHLRHVARVDAGTHLRTVLLHDRTDRDGPVRVGELGGFDLLAGGSRLAEGPPSVEITFKDVPVTPLAIERGDLARADPAGLIQRLENRLVKLGEVAGRYQADAARSRNEAAAMAERIGRPFEHHDRLEGLRARLAEIDQTLAPIDPPPVPAVTASPPAGLSPSPTSVPSVPVPTDQAAAPAVDTSATPPPHQLGQLHRHLYPAEQTGPVALP
jgi:hypothetical protein